MTIWVLNFSSENIPCVVGERAGFYLDFMLQNKEDQVFANIPWNGHS